MSAISNLFTSHWSNLGIGSKPKSPPTGEDTAEAKRRRMEELSRRRGRSASILTGGGGLTTEPTLGKSSLLGAG